MWHLVTSVAEVRGLDAARLRQFAIDREAKYGIVIDGLRGKVSTWHVDALVQDFSPKYGTSAIGVPR